MHTDPPAPQEPLALIPSALVPDALGETPLTGVIIEREAQGLGLPPFVHELPVSVQCIRERPYWPSNFASVTADILTAIRFPWEQLKS